MTINPLSPRSPVVTGTNKVKGSSQSRTTAAKVSQIQVPICGGPALRGRPVTLLKEARNLSKYIAGHWDEWTPEEQAGKVIELEDKVALIKEPSAAVEKVRREAEDHHFHFVFPVSLELAKGANPLSFAKTVLRAANEVFKTNSLRPFNEMNGTQKQEIMRHAGRVS